MHDLSAKRNLRVTNLEICNYNAPTMDLLILPILFLYLVWWYVLRPIGRVALILAGGAGRVLGWRRR